MKWTPFKKEITLLQPKNKTRKVSKMSLLEIFCDFDDFWQAFFPFGESVNVIGYNLRRRGSRCAADAPFQVEYSIGIS
jgi:hypothetical protein